MSDYVRYLGGYTGLAALVAVTAATGTAAYVYSQPTPVDIRIDLGHQSKDVPGGDYARISSLCDHNRLIESFHDDVTTCYDAFLHGARISNNGPCLGCRVGVRKKYSWISYNDVLTRASNLASGFIEKGLQANNSTFVGIYSQNRPEYVITQLACYMNCMVIVPLYDTLGPEASTYILEQAEIQLVVCDTDSKVSSLLEHVKQTPKLKTIVCMEQISEDNIARSRELGLEVILFPVLEDLGKFKPHAPKPCNPEDLAVICYTSGTTGVPKGAMITHRNLIAGVSAVLAQLGNIEVGPSDVMISYLPLAHVYEILNEALMYTCGGQVGFFQGDIKELLSDIAELRPTIFPSVPRLLNRIYDKVMATVHQGGAIKKCLFSKAMASKATYLQKGIICNNTIWDKLVFRKVQQSLGGRVRLISSGSAPLSGKVMTFIRCASGCAVVEGYGQTESSGIGTVTVIGDSETGHVGAPVPCAIFKLVDVPEKGYYASKGQGEICMKGHNVFKGYWKNPAKTEEALDSDGWLHSGDIGTWLPNGALKIIDRKKHIFKLAQGEYIAPEKIENIYIRSPHVAQIFVHGDSLKACLVGIVVPDPETVPRWAKDTFKLTGTMTDICSNQNVKKAILEDLEAIGKRAGLKSFEQVRDVHLFPELFSVQNGLLTPTFKTKREDVAKYFINEITDMYETLD